MWRVKTPSSNYVREKRCIIVARNGERCAGRGQTVVCHVDVCFFKCVQQGFPGFAFLSLHVVWIHLEVIGLSDK